MSRPKSLKKQALERIITTSMEDPSDSLTLKCKFNLSYFTIQKPGISFQDLTEEQCKKMFEKIKEYSRESLKHWEKVKHGVSTEFAIYGSFPKKSQFTHPMHVPHQAEWARFRLEGDFRLVGFIVPEELHGTEHTKSGERFDRNTFYIVFLDPDHQFYIS